MALNRRVEVNWMLIPWMYLHVHNMKFWLFLVKSNPGTRIYHSATSYGIKALSFAKWDGSKNLICSEVKWLENSIDYLPYCIIMISIFILRHHSKKDTFGVWWCHQASRWSISKPDAGCVWCYRTWNRSDHHHPLLQSAE